MAVHQELIASSTSPGSPSRISVSRAPRAPTATTGGTASAPIVLYGCHKCAASIALICSGVSPGVAAAIENEGKAAGRFARDLSLRSALTDHGFDAPPGRPVRGPRCPFLSPLPAPGTAVTTGPVGRDLRRRDAGHAGGPGHYDGLEFPVFRLPQRRVWGERLPAGALRRRFLHLPGGVGRYRCGDCRCPHRTGGFPVEGLVPVLLATLGVRHRRVELGGGLH